jgi:hypothetical protein
MKNQILSEEFTRMQKLAGIISEIKATNPNDIRFLSALGTLFNYSDEDPDYPYEWDDKEIRKLVKSLGYKDWKGVASEVTHYFPPDDEDYLRIIANQEDRPDLQVEDLTIGMIVKNILEEFPYEPGEPIEVDSYMSILKEIKPTSPYLYNIIARKVNNLDTKMIDNILHVDFDEIGTLWSEAFEEAFGREYDDVEGSDEDYDNFEKIQDISLDLLSNNGEIDVYLDY